MQYKTFGQTGIRVSTLGYGALRLPTLEDETCDIEKSLPLLTRGIDLGKRMGSHLNAVLCQSYQGSFTVEHGN